MSIKNYLDPKYLNGVDEFLKFAFLGKDPNCKLPCPCKICNDFDDQTMKVMADHLCEGIVDSYIRWIYHGESLNMMMRMIYHGDHLCEVIVDS